MRTKAIKAGTMLHPRRGDTWFKELSPGRRADFHRWWNEDRAHGAAAKRSTLTTLGMEALHGALLLGVFDLVASGGRLETLFAALFAGSVVGLLWVWTQAGRFLAPVTAITAFAASRFLSHGALDAWTLSLCVFLGGASAYHALNRNDPWA